jgi:hypothetical protein
LGAELLLNVELTVIGNELLKLRELVELSVVDMVDNVGTSIIEFDLKKSGALNEVKIINQDQAKKNYS